MNSNVIHKAVSFSVYVLGNLKINTVLSLIYKYIMGFYRCSQFLLILNGTDVTANQYYPTEFY